ncbi:MAG: hypothetical protein AAF764_01100 [Pseudomonadota bacterium]
MTLDIRGSLKNTRISKNPLVVVDELLANSIDAFLIRKRDDSDAVPLDVTLRVTATTVDLLGEEYDLEITCEDNGCGLGPDQRKAFLTKDTSYKDDLNIPGIGKCKGTGRVQFFHHFTAVSLSSNYREGDRLKHISLPFLRDRKTVEETDFTFSDLETGEVGTFIRLGHVVPTLRANTLSVASVNQTFAAEAIRQHVLFNLLQRFVSLKNDLGDFQIKFVSDIEGTISEQTLTPADIPEHTSVAKITVEQVEGLAAISADFTITHYKLNEMDYALPRNIVGLCAKASIVELITSRYLRTKTLENNAIDGHYHIVLIEGALLDDCVNEQRDGFDKIPLDSGSFDMFVGMQITFEDIFSVLDDKVQELITPPDLSKDAIVQDVAKDFGVSKEMLSYSSTRVKFGDTSYDVAKRVLTNLQEQVIEETSSLSAMKEEIKALAPDSEDFRRMVNDLSWKYASSLKTIDMANLSQLVVRRSLLIDALDLAVKEGLRVQLERSEGERRRNEALIHNIFFPMRKDSKEFSDHDVWLLSEEYHYYDYIASDTPLSRIKWSDGKTLFEPDIDEAVGELLDRIAEDNSGGRPDLALFHEEGSAIIVEFKAPGVSMDAHHDDLFEYATLLAAKSRGRLKKFYGYLIGDTLNPIRLGGYSKLPGEQGYFRTVDIREPSTQVAVGQLYSELIFYEDIVKRARNRIGVYRERLKLPKD